MSAVLAFFGTRLGQYTLMAAVAIATAVAFGAYERSIGYREAMDHAFEQRKAEEDAYLAIMAKRARAFAALTAKYAQLSAKHETDLKEAERKRLADLEALKGKVPAYVPANARSCRDLPVGYLLFRHNAADEANGRDPTAPEPSAELAAAASGVPLPALAVTDADQANAFRACTDRVKGWEQYAADVETWAASVNAILKEAP